MARINIEDSLFKDIRFTDLCLKTQSIDTALGSLVRAWSLAQKWYLTDDRLIPLSDWKQQRINDLIIDVGLAEVVDNKVRVVGSDTQFAWLIQKSEAGKKSAANKKDRNDDILGGPVQHPSTDVNGSQPLTLSLPLTPSLTTNSNSDSKSLIQSPLGKPSASSKQLFKISSPTDLNEILEQKQKHYLGELYPDAEFVKRELFKIQNWLDANPKKNNKSRRGWATFVSGWFDRAWPKYQNSLPSNVASKKTSAEEIMSIMGWTNE